MALLLSIETSGPSCSVALHRGGEQIGFLQINEPQAHAARLAPMIDRLFRDSSLTPKMIDAVCVSSGPGSYTGLRIGTSTAKGICFALDKPLIAVNTLDLLACQAKKLIAEPGYLCPMIDARRMEVYCQVLDPDINQVMAVDARIIDGDSFAELFAHDRVFFFGNGAEKCKTVLTHHHAVFIDGVVPEASVLGEMAWVKFRKAQFEDLAAFTPLYLKEFIAKKAQPFF